MIFVDGEQIRDVLFVEGLILGYDVFLLWSGNVPMFMTSGATLSTP